MGEIGLDRNPIFIGEFMWSLDDYSIIVLIKFE